MNTPRFCGLMLYLLGCSAAAGGAAPAVQENYPVHPDSVRQEGVPQGEMLRFTFDKSKIFPGTTREYWIYVPAQYQPGTPACLYVNQDGISWSANIVFDNLIAKKEMPVTIGVFVQPGIVPAANATTELPRYNRSYEYDSLGDNYARFLLEELLPEVETKKATDGRAIHLSKSANDRAIGGASSGAIAAFTAAWEHPEAFSRVWSAIGTYVDLRGGFEYPSLIRKYEPKPIRIFLQSGTNDNNHHGGDWWMANQTMERALQFAGYEVNHVWGEGTHSSRHGTAIFPDVMRWLWKDWPTPVKAGPGQNAYLNALLIPGENWKLIGEGYGLAQGAAANAQGEVFFNDVTAGKTYKIGPDGKPGVFAENNGRAIGQKFGADGKLYSAAAGDEKITVYTPDGKSTVIAQNLRGHDLVVTPGGNVYVTNPPTAESNALSNLYLIRPGAEKILVDTGIKFGGGVTLTPDHSQLYVADHRSHWVYTYQIAPDGTLKNKQAYGYLHTLDTADKSGAYGMDVDRDGRLYVATYMGIQVLDQPGKVECIIPTPLARATSVCFGGPNFDTLYVTSGDKVFSRKLNVKGVPSWGPPLKPPTPRL